MTRARLLRLAALAGLALVLAGCGSATSAIPNVSVSVGSGSAASGGGQFAIQVQLLVAMAVLAVVPSILLLATSFTRIVVVLSLVRSAIGIPQLPPNQVLVGLALFLTLFVMAPTIKEINDTALTPYTNGAITDQVALDRSIASLRGFMIRQTDEATVTAFVGMSKTARPAKIEDVPTEVLLPAFVTSELRKAFTMGFLIFLPFLVIDLVVASVLMSMGMVMVAPTQIALPFKLLLFVLLNGWMLLAESLVRSFA